MWREGSGRDEAGEERLTFGDVAGFVLAEPGQVFVFHPGDPGFVLRVVLFLCPLHFGWLGWMCVCVRCLLGDVYVCIYVCMLRMRICWRYEIWMGGSDGNDRNASEGKAAGGVHGIHISSRRITSHHSMTTAPS